MANDTDSGAYLINFLHKYTQLVQKQLLGVRTDTVGTVETVMEGVAGISNATEGRQKHAEMVLENTFIRPDVETEVLMEDLQRFVDELFEEATQRFKDGKDLDNFVSSEPEVLVMNRIKRLSGKFSGEMDALHQLNDDLKNVVFGIIGALSSEDVIAQKLQHVTMSLKALQTGLNYVLIDFDKRCKKDELEKVVSGIKNYTLKQYTTEEERRQFEEIFDPKRSA